jgi:glycosyltransferase involved in cell wall biosynthesis
LLFRHFNHGENADHHRELRLPFHPDFYRQPTSLKAFGKEVIILFFGRTENVCYLKGMDIAIRACEILQAFSYIRDQNLTIKLVVVGVTPGSETLAEQKLLAKQSTANRSFAPQIQAFASLRMTGVFIMPSRCEPFGLVAMEAIACGTPTLVSSNSGIALLLREVDKAAADDLMILKTSAHKPSEDAVQSKDLDPNLDADANDWASKLLRLIQNDVNTFKYAMDIRAKLNEHIKSPYQSLVDLGKKDVGELGD